MGALLHKQIRLPPPRVQEEKERKFQNLKRRASGRAQPDFLLGVSASIGRLSARVPANFHEHASREVRVRHQIGSCHPSYAEE